MLCTQDSCACELGPAVGSCLLTIAKYKDNYLRSAGVPPAVSGASRSRCISWHGHPGHEVARGQDAHATAGETPALRKQFVTLVCNPRSGALECCSGGGLPPRVLKEAWGEGRGGA